MALHNLSLYPGAGNEGRIRRGGPLAGFRGGDRCLQAGVQLYTYYEGRRGLLGRRTVAQRCSYRPWNPADNRCRAQCHRATVRLAASDAASVRASLCLLCILLHSLAPGAPCCMPALARISCDVRPCSVLFQVLDSPCAERQGGMYDELKRFLKPARLFERDFVIMPIKLPGHWAVMVICFPLSVVQSLLQLSCRDGAASATSLQAVKPGIIYLDSMGSKGSWWRAAAAQVLVETYAAQQCELSCPDLAQWPRRQQVPGPELSPPGQIDMWRCGDHVLHYVRRFIRDMALAALDSGSRKTPVDLERTITPGFNLTRSNRSANLLCNTSIQEVCRKKSEPLLPNVQGLAQSQQRPASGK